MRFPWGVLLGVLWFLAILYLWHHLGCSSATPC